MSVLAGTIDEWVQVEPGVWMRYVVMPRSPWGARELSDTDGPVFIFSGTFDEYWESCLNPPPEPPSIYDLLSALETRLSAVEKERKVTPSKREDK